ncbi:MAG: hypothetical protein C4311_10070 [Chloroflexota bacterium]
MSTAAPRGATCPWPFKAPGPTSSTTPLKPRTSPITTRRLGRAPRHSQPSSAIHKGEVAINTAARPEGTICSAQTTPPFPPSNSNAPTIAVLRHWNPWGRGTPCNRIQAYSTAPAMRKRVPAIKKGGNVSMAKRIAR